MKIKHVYGNVLRLDIPLTIKIVTSEGGHAQETEEPFYPDTSKPVLVELANQYNITKYTYDATMTENVAHIEDYGGIKIGLYKVTVKCYDEQGQPYRYMARDIVEIVDATADAGIEAGIEFNSETYTLEGAVFISYGVEQVQSDWNEQDDKSKAYIKNKPDLTQYATKNELREVEDEIPILPDHIVTDEYYVHTDNNYTDAEKEKLADLENYDDSEIRQELGGKVDKEQGKGLSTNDYTNEEKTKLANAITEEQDPTVPSWAKQSAKPSYNAQEVGALPNTTKYGSTIDLSMDSTTYVLTLSLKDQDGTVLNTKTVDLPIESVVVNGRYDAINKKIVLTLQSGSTIDVPVGDLIAGLQTEITSVNMLDADLVDDANSTHKFVTTQEKTTWNNKSDFSGNYNDLTDKPTIPVVPTNVSAFNNDAGYLTQHQDISGKADKSEMSVVDGTGTDADKTTITLKNGTSATVLKSHQDISGKQDTLVSGSNIKTINNQSILGSGNITIQGGGSSVQSDWNQTDTEADDYIKNKPTNVSAFTNDAGYLTQHQSLGNYYTKTEVNGLVDTPHQEYVTVATYASLPAQGSADTIYRVSNYNGSTSQVDESVYSEYTWNGSQYIFLCVKSQIGEVFDISVYNNNAKYADLTAALNGGANIPQSLQKGGMSVKFVRTSDNKYVEYFLTKNEWSANEEDWQESTPLIVNFATIESDLDISDESGNVLARFAGGHIRTKNFDSSIEPKPLEGRTFSILGDSISTFQGYLRSDEQGYDGATYAYYYPKTFLNNVNQTWWKKLESLTGMTLLQNCAWSGSQVCGNSQSTTSAQAGCSTRRISDLSKNGVAPDIILILIGVNDLRNSDSRALGDWDGNDEIVAESTNVNTFSSAYSLMVSKIMTTYPNSEVFCCTILDTGHSGWDTHDNAKYPCMNDRGNTTKEWNDTIRMVCESLGANVLDMHSCGIDFFNLDTYTGDRLHPNANGATLMAKKAARELISKSNLTIK